MNVKIHTRQEHGSRIADVVRISTRKPTYLPSVQAVVQAQARNSGAGVNVLG